MMIDHDETMSEMTTLLQEALTPTELTIENESHLHVGHEGAKSGKGHFYVNIASPLFEGKRPLQQHQLVYSALGELMTTKIHALRLTTR